MRNVSEKMYKKSKQAFYIPQYFSENSSVSIIMWKNVVWPERTQLAL